MQPSTRQGLLCHSTQVTIDPTPDYFSQHKDYYGNRVHSFSIENLHRSLSVVVKSDVTVTSSDHQKQNNPPIAWETVAVAFEPGNPRSQTNGVEEFEFDSPRIRQSSEFEEYARQSFTAGRDIISASLDLTQRIYKDFRYDPRATDVDTPTEEAFKKRAGVCQDFAQIQIACLRSLGLSAKYISGYLRTKPKPGQPRLIGADESHAWISVFAGEENDWVACDPTNGVLANNDHIPVCYGRDYSDVSPMRGVVLGGGKTRLDVSVDVLPIEQGQ